jgi:hypothetical protein
LTARIILRRRCPSCPSDCTRSGRGESRKCNNLARLFAGVTTTIPHLRAGSPVQLQPRPPMRPFPACFVAPAFPSSHQEIGTEWNRAEAPGRSAQIPAPLRLERSGREFHPLGSGTVRVEIKAGPLREN